MAESSLPGPPEILEALRRAIDAARERLAEPGKPPTLVVEGAEADLAFLLERFAGGHGHEIRVAGIGDASRPVHRVKVRLRAAATPAPAGAKGAPPRPKMAETLTMDRLPTPTKPTGPDTLPMPASLPAASGSAPSPPRTRAGPRRDASRSDVTEAAARARYVCSPPVGGNRGPV